MNGDENIRRPLEDMNDGGGGREGRIGSEYHKIRLDQGQLSFCT